MFEVGHESFSCTKTPSFYPLDGDVKETFLVDCPGFGDSDVFSEFPNMTLIRKVVSAAKQAIICFVIKASSIEA